MNDVTEVTERSQTEVRKGSRFFKQIEGEMTTLCVVDVVTRLDRVVLKPMTWIVYDMTAGEKNFTDEKMLADSFYKELLNGWKEIK